MTDSTILQTDTLPAFCQKEIPAGALPESKIDDFSLHQVPTSNLLRELQEQRGIRVMVLACDVGQIEQVIQPGLSPEVHQAMH